MSTRIVIIGAGIGGLTTGALLAQAGYDVTVLERHTYAGGSAATFYHQGYRFDAGAMVAGGFLIQLVRTGVRHFPDDLRLFPLLFTTTRQWISRYGLAEDRAFVRFIDAQLLISAQTTSQHANALYSATALDLARQGVVHVEGGMGMVGGFPQTSLFNTRGPQTGIATIKLVSDSIFPGQSTAAVTLGAIRVARTFQTGLA